MSLQESPSTARPLFNAATRPADIPFHDGTTHLMFAPMDDDNATLITRWQGVHDAVQLAGGHVQVITQPHDYPYARDLFVLVEETAYHPSVPRSIDPRGLDYRRRAFAPFIEHYGYQLHGLNTLPDYGMDGGNFVHLEDDGILLTGQHSIFGEADDLNMDELYAKRAIAATQMQDLCSLRATTWHIDSVAGLLPDGRVMIKLDETDHSDALADTGVDDAYLAMTGIKNGQLHWLSERIGRERCLTFSLFDHPDADVVCGLESVAGNNIAARAFGLAANGTLVSDVFVGETMPAPLATRLKADGIRTITPKDVGAETFLLGDEGFVGAARCLTLPVRHQRYNLF